MSIIRTIKVRCDTVLFERLPADIRRALGKEEADAYRGGLQYFTEKASACKYRPMRKFFRLLGTAGAMDLLLYAEARPKYQVYFGFNLWKLGRYLQLRLASGVRLPGDPPKPLDQLYEDIGGLIDGEELSVFWNAPEEMKSVADQRLNPSDTGGCDVEQSYPLFNCGNGDSYGYAGRRRCFQYDHERGRLARYDLVDFAARYFGDYQQTMCM